MRAPAPGCPSRAPADDVHSPTLAGLLAVDAYMTNYVCNSTTELIEKQNFTRTGEADKASLLPVEQNAESGAVTAIRTTEAWVVLAHLGRYSPCAA
jgi:hypothetical protein